MRPRARAQAGAEGEGRLGTKGSPSDLRFSSDLWMDRCLQGAACAGAATWRRRGTGHGARIAWWVAL